MAYTNLTPSSGDYSKPKKKAAPAKLKVSQATIDHIKKIGMKRALEEVNMYANQGKKLGAGGKDMREQGQQFLKGEMAEGIRRMYGDRRFKEATTSPQRGSLAASTTKTVKKAATTKPVVKKTVAKKTATRGGNSRSRAN